MALAFGSRIIMTQKQSSMKENTDMTGDVAKESFAFLMETSMKEILKMTTFMDSGE